MDKSGGFSVHKGAAYERNICQRLSMWVSGFTRKDCFWRSSMSGGRSTIFRQRGEEGAQAHAGDIVATHELGNHLMRKFCVECKCYSDLELSKACYGYDTARILEFWKQATEQATDREGILVAKADRQHELVGLSDAGWNLVDPEHKRMSCLVYFPNAGLNLFLFRELLCIPYNELRGRWQ